MYLAPVPAVTHAKLAPVFVFVAPALVVNTFLQLLVYAAPAPMLEYVAPILVCEYVAPATAVTYASPAQQFLAAYTMAAVKAGVNLDITGLVNPTVLQYCC